MWTRQIGKLVKRELLNETRQQYAVFGIILFVVSTIFIARFSFKAVKEIPTWNALFWIIMLFAAVTGIARSFAQESRGKLLYLYTVADPRALLVAKMIYNKILLVALGLAGIAIYGFLIGFPVQNVGLYILAVVLGCSALASGFTMISAIASKGGNNFALMAILGFPVLLPVLMAGIRLSKFAADGLTGDGAWQYAGLLIALNVAVSALAYLLFPYLWRD